MYTNIRETQIQQKSSHPIIVYLSIFIFLYAILGFDRIKKFFSFNVEGHSVTNELWIIPLICYFIYFFDAYSRRRLLISKENLFFINIIFLYVIIILVGGMNLVSYSHYFYASTLFIVPMLMYFPMSRIDIKQTNLILKIFLLSCLFYAVFAIILSTNYAFFMELVGNPINYRYNSQYRAAMMIGSSITVSYYLNLTLPLCFYFFYRNAEIKWRYIALITISVNIIATFILLSRAASLIAILISIVYVLFLGSKNNRVKNKLLILFMLVIGVFYSYFYYDLSRIISGFGSEGASTDSRLNTANLGLNIFYDFPLFGSGMGRFFKRVYESRYIEVNGINGLIDPHNMYIMIMSEMGIAGLFVTVLMFAYFFYNFSFIRDNALRRTAFITIIAFLIGGIGGTHLFINISFATVFWIYMGVFNAISIHDRKASVSSRKKLL